MMICTWYNDDAESDMNESLLVFSWWLISLAFKWEVKKGMEQKSSCNYIFKVASGWVLRIKSVFLDFKGCETTLKFFFLFDDQE